MGDFSLDFGASGEYKGGLNAVKVLDITWGVD
jgi:hypothetical protein